MAENKDRYAKLEEPTGKSVYKNVEDIIPLLERSDISLGNVVSSFYGAGDYSKRGDISFETYERMMKRSAIIKGARNKFYESLISDRPNLTYVGDDEEKGQKMKEYLAFAFPEYKLNNFIWNILGAVFYGFSVAEYTYQGREFQGRMVITPPTYKPSLLKFLKQKYVTFHEDMYGNLIVNHRSPNIRDKTKYKHEHGISYSEGVFGAERYYLSPNKALVTTFNSENENRYGVGLLRAEYEPWYILDKIYMIWSVYVERKGIPAKVFLGKESDQCKEFAENADRGIHQNYYGDKETFDVKILEPKTMGQQFKTLTDDLKYLIYFGLGLPTTGIVSRASADSASTEYDEYARTKKQAYRMFVEDNINKMFTHYLKLNFNIEDGEPVPFLRFPPIIKGDISKYSDAVLKLRTIGLINDEDYDVLRWYYFGLENMKGEPDPLKIDNKIPNTKEGGE